MTSAEQEDVASRGGASRRLDTIRTGLPTTTCNSNLWPLQPVQARPGCSLCTWVAKEAVGRYKYFCLSTRTDLKGIARR
jgi:hypothetical protein